MSNEDPTSSDVTLKEAFDIYQKQSDSVHKLWAYFQVVSLAVLGYTIGSEKAHWSTGTYVLIGTCYFMFSAANQWVIVFSQRELETFGSAVSLAAKKSGDIGQKLAVSAVAPWKVAVFHTLSALIVVVAIAAAWVEKFQEEVCPKPQSSEMGSMRSCTELDPQHRCVVRAWRW